MRFCSILCAGCLYLLASSGSLCAGQGKSKVPSAVGKAAGAAAKAARNPGRPVPADQLRKMLGMSPEQRQKALDASKLTVPQRERVQKQLDTLDRMPPAQREQQLNWIGRLETLPAPRQRAVNQQIQAMNGMTVAQKRAIIQNPEFEQRFSPEEQDLIRERFPNAARDPRVK